MQETLVIRFQAAAADATHTEGTAPDTQLVQWLLVDANGAHLQALQHGTLSDAAAHATDRRVIAVLPGSEALHFEPVLPVLKGNTKLAQVVPYALEDQLATDVDELHFAVGKRFERGDAPAITPVTVISHDAMQRRVLALRQVGLTAQAIYAEDLLLPHHPGITSVLIDAGRVSVQRQIHVAQTLDVAPLSEALSLLLPSAEESLTVYTTEAEYDANQNTIEALRERHASVQVKLLADGVLPLLALQAQQRGGINLLQGPYAMRAPVSGGLKPWRYAAALMAALLLTHVAVQSFKVWRLGQQEVALDAQIEQTLKQGIPDANGLPASDARRAFESRLMQLQASRASSGLMSGFDTLAAAIGQTPTLQINALSFRNTSIDLQLVAPNVDALEKLRQQAQARNLSAEIQAANPKDNKIEGRLQLKLPAGA